MSHLLEVQDVESFYGASQVLFGIEFQVGRGEVVTLLGRNGMGKSTTVKSIMGMLAPRRGSIRLAGRDLAGQPSYRVAQAGIGLVPEQRQVFPNLTVRENLVATAHNRQQLQAPWTLARVYALFPRLQERQHNLGANLSGGEQQMLAIGRALMTNPRLLILDEATEGLAPLVREEIWACLARLRDTGLSMIVIDKNLGPLLRLADRHHIVEKGEVVWQGNSDQLRAQPGIQQRYLGV
ncbi:ABC transporter ATP-binding protein [Cupriavidus sp. H39]|uniref:ABC transporter ATP-binding protein n=1 Tax=Cupriavidus sp. H39 TaxID=3401635 RepID=UPI003D044E48